MLFFSHLGLTLVTVAAAGFLTSRFQHEKPFNNSHEAKETPPVNLQDKRRRDLLGGFLDLRLWALGSLLPDIIDKPVGRYLFAGFFQYNGRIFSHTLLLLVLLLAAACFLPRYKGRGWLLAVSAGVLMHLILDSMWRTPQTLLWPLLGWGFPSGSEGDWLGSLVQVLAHNPAVFIPELIGAAILAALALYSLRRHGLKRLLSSGRLN